MSLGLTGWSFAAAAASIAGWDFNSVAPDGNTDTGSLTPSAGFGSAALVGNVTASFTASNGSSDPNATDNSNWRVTGWPAQGTQNKQNGIQFSLSTQGWRRVGVTWDLRNSNTASKYLRLQFSTNGTDFLDFKVIAMTNETWVTRQTASFVGVPGVEENPRFVVRFVTEFERTATGSGADGYVPSKLGSAYGSAGTLRFDMVSFTGEPTAASLSVVSYNILGNGATNWSLASTNVQAVGRQLSHLKPDLVGFQEIPEAFFTQMTNFLALYLPQHTLTLGQRTDGGERSGVASRYPIRRAQSWLARSNLTPFGFDGVFTRDLFEAEIVIPGFPQPLHFFTTHLKAHPDETSSVRRAAEARAISNYFVTQFLPAHPGRTFALVGDMNEDIYRPRTYEQGAIQTLTSAPTGLRLTTPRNPATQDERTWSIQNSSLTIRFDYVLPCGFLLSNTVSSQVFRSDKVSPLAPPLLASDSATGADHLPVVITFGNPYVPPIIYASGMAGGQFSMKWSSQPGQEYRIESSPDWVTWATNDHVRVAVGTNGVWNAAVGAEPKFYRVVRAFPP